MNRKIQLPKHAECTPDATVVRWRKAAGDSFQKGEALVELAGLRATILVKTPDDGSLVRQLAQVGQTVIPGADLAEISAGAGAAATQPSNATQATTKEKPMSSPKGVVTPVLMPQASNTMEEGTIVKWHVAEGDTIAVGQVIFEVETDKASVEVEATDAGKLARIVVAENDSIEVLKPVAYLADSADDVDAYIAQNGGAPAPEAKEEAPAPAAAPATAERVIASPAAKQAAQASNVDIASLTPGSGPSGRVVLADVSKASGGAVTASGRVKASPAARRLALERGINLALIGPGSGPGGRIVSSDVPATAAAVAPAAKPAAKAAPASTGPVGEKTRAKMSPMRKAIARNLLASKQNIPHFYIEMTIDASAMMSYYKACKAQYPCSVNDVVVLACGRAIAEFPSFRSQIAGEEIVTFPTANIGVAVGMDDGLVVPVVVAADRMNLQQVGSETKRIAESARKGKIEGMGQGVFTISNLGMFGIHRFQAIINPPEAAILAVGAVREDVIVKDGAIKPTRVMTVTLSCDHRVIDGMEAAKFLGRLKELLESPAIMG